MHGHPNVKFAIAKQAKDTLSYKNIKRKLHRTTAAIWYNKICRSKHLTPNYTAIRINGNKRQDRNTIQAATIYRINQEVKFLYIKKTKLNEQLHRKHLECAAQWPNNWPTIQDLIDHNLRVEMEAHYEKLNKKLDKLQQQQQQQQRQQRDAHRNHHSKAATYPRTINLTNIQFTTEEQALLDLGLQYNLQKPTASTWKNLALETERAIRLLDVKDQQAYRTTAAKKLKQMLDSNHHNTTHKRQWHIIKQIKQKIDEGKALIARADKGKTTVIIYTHDYNQRTHTFISNNNFHTITKDPTSKYHNAIHKALQNCDRIIEKRQIKYLVQKNPTPPTLNAFLKIHKPNTPIRQRC
jgi:hypothetical protein